MSNDFGAALVSFTSYKKHIYIFFIIKNARCLGFYFSTFYSCHPASNALFLETQIQYGDPYFTYLCKINGARQTETKHIPPWFNISMQCFTVFSVIAYLANCLLQSCFH